MRDGLFKELVKSVKEGGAILRGERPGAAAAAFELGAGPPGAAGPGQGATARCGEASATSARRRVQRHAPQHESTGAATASA